MRAPERARRILVVEADAAIGELIIDVLETAGFAVQTVPNATEALEALGRHPPDAILVDLAEPGAEGWAFLERCRQQPGCNKLPMAIMSTTLAQAAAAASAREQGYGWLPKPFELNHLLALMDSLTRSERRARKRVRVSGRGRSRSDGAFAGRLPRASRRLG